MGKLIDADELELDTEWSDYYDGFVSYSQSQIDTMEEVKAIPLEKIKQVREEMEGRLYKGTPQTTGFTWQNLGVNMCLGILDKLIEEVDQ